MKSAIFKILDVIKTQNSLIATVSLDSTHSIYKGHFPNKPITPGVIFFQIIKQLLENHFEQPLRISEIKNAKFLKPVIPEDGITLIFELTFSESNDTIIVKNHSTFRNNDALFNCNATFVKISRI